MDKTFPAPSNTEFLVVADADEYVVSEVTTHGYYELARGETPYRAFVNAADAINENYE